MSKISYESICEKLGFDVDNYVPPIGDTEDDSKESPFKSLEREELDFLISRIESRKSA